MKNEKPIKLPIFETSDHHVSSTASTSDSSPASPPTPSSPARLARAGPARKRASRPKVRTGCISCKQRHLKCDEKKPRCLRCEGFGIPCRGYTPATTASGDRCPSRRRQKALLPRPQWLFRADTATKSPIKADQGPHNVETQPPQVLGSPHTAPVPLPRLTCRDAHYLAFFSRQVADQVSPYCPSRFWSIISRREIMSNECVLHAVLALGAWCVAVEESRQGLGAQQHGRGTDHHCAALAHYSKAIEILRSSLRQRPDARTSLIATLLFIAFENLQGNRDASGRLVRHGLKILDGEALQGRKKTANIADEERLPSLPSKSSASAQPIRGANLPAPQRSSSCEDGDMAEMAQMYARHSVTTLFMPLPDCKSAYHMLIETHPRSDGTSTLVLLRKGGFSSPHEARAAWDFHLPSFASFVQKCTWHNLNVGYDFDLLAARREQSSHQAWLRLFGTALERLSAAYGTDTPPADMAETGHLDETRVQSMCAPGSALLGLQHAAVTILCACCLDPSEATYDVHVRQFRRVVSRCYDLVAEVGYGNSSVSFGRPTCLGHDRKRSGSDHQRIPFLNDGATIPILGFVACKCRDWQVRKRALGLLEHRDWREGSWDSGFVTRVVRALFGLERAGQGPEDARAVPPSARFAWTGVVSDPARSAERLEFTRLMPGPDGEYEKTWVLVDSC